MAANVVHSPAAGANGAPPNLLTGFEGPHEAEKERGKGRKGG